MKGFVYIPSIVNFYVILGTQRTKPQFSKKYLTVVLVTIPKNAVKVDIPLSKVVVNVR